MVTGRSITSKDLASLMNRLRTPNKFNKNNNHSKKVMNNTPNCKTNNRRGKKNTPFL